MKLEFSRRIFEKYSRIRFHKNHLSVGTDRQIWLKLIGPFRNFANVHKNEVPALSVSDVVSRRC